MPNWKSMLDVAASGMDFPGFAIPLCMPDEKIDALTAPFIAALKSITATSLPDLEKTSSIPDITGLLNAHYKPVCLTSEDNKIHAQA